MPQIIKLEKPKAVEHVKGGFIQTETAKDIRRSLDLIRSINGPAVTMISGAPGIGKTETLAEYMAEKGEEVIYIAIAKGEGNPSHVAATILRQFGCYKKDGNDLTSQRWQIGQYIGSRRILLVDEAQNLFQRNKASCTKGSSFGWLVSASEESGFDLVFCGDLTLQSIMLEFPHLKSRMRRPIIVKSVPRADVAALASDGGISEPQGLELLVAVASLDGGLRNVDNVLRVAELFAAGKLILATHIKAAIQDLKLHMIGGK